MHTHIHTHVRTYIIQTYIHIYTHVYIHTRTYVHSTDSYVCQNEVTNMPKIQTIQNARYIITVQNAINTCILCYGSPLQNTNTHITV